MVLQLDTTAVATGYLEAWNRHDPEAIVATFSPEGTFVDPLCPDGVRGQALAQYAGAMFAAFPDLSFEAVSVQLTEGESDVVALQWLMRGTNTGPLQGNPPTGGTVALPGADFITIADGAVQRVEGYWDQKTFVEQLGLQAMVMPVTLGPMSFGIAARMTAGKLTKPGAFSVTWLQARSLEEEIAVRTFTIQRIVPELATLPGFLGLTITGVDGWMSTITALGAP